MRSETNGEIDPSWTMLGMPEASEMSAMMTAMSFRPNPNHHNDFHDILMTSFSSSSDALSGVSSGVSSGVFSAAAGPSNPTFAGDVGDVGSGDVGSGNVSGNEDAGNEGNANTSNADNMGNADNANNTGDTGDLCTICLTPPSPSQAAILDGCQHRYCYECIATWAQSGRSNSDKCPCCLRRFTGITRVNGMNGVHGVNGMNPLSSAAASSAAARVLTPDFHQYFSSYFERDARRWRDHLRESSHATPATPTRQSRQSPVYSSGHDYPLEYLQNTRRNSFSPSPVVSPDSNTRASHASPNPSQHPNSNHTNPSPNQYPPAATTNNDYFHIHNSNITNNDYFRTLSELHLTEAELIQMTIALSLSEHERTERAVGTEWGAVDSVGNNRAVGSVGMAGMPEITESMANGANGARSVTPDWHSTPPTHATHTTHSTPRSDARPVSPISPNNQENTHHETHQVTVPTASTASTTSTVGTADEAEEVPVVDVVYVAASLKGTCYHSNEHCSRLKTARGTRSMSLQGANERGMRACSVCSPRLDPSSRRNQTSATNDCVPARPSRQIDQIGQTVTGAGPVTRVSSASGESNLNGESVYVASSGKGQCYHSRSDCSRLKRCHDLGGVGGVGGVSRISLQSAADNGKRKCSTCYPRHSCGNGSSGRVGRVGSTLVNGRIYPATPLNRPTPPPRQFQQLQQYPPTRQSRQTHSSSSSLSSTYLSSSSSSSSNGSSSGSNQANQATPYYITPSGQCYHKSRQCSALRRSTSVKTLNRLDSTGKRPCKKCC